MPISSKPRDPVRTGYPIGGPPQAPPSVSTTFANEGNSIKEAQDIYEKHRREHLDAGKSPMEAHKYGLRMMQHAGWYKTSGNKWKRLTPDLRKKINVREAVKQPDGRFVIEDVDVFYPNAVKLDPNEEPIMFNPPEIQRMIDNTNAAIEAGGQKPGLVIGHPHADQKALGIQQDVLGHPVRWRPSDRGEGWVRCDLVDVTPDTVDRMKDRRLTGLSAAINRDARGLNRRFGHVALLGGDTQSLSHLPLTEIYSASSQLCFSAETEPFTHKHTKGRATMAMNPKMLSAGKDCYDAMSAAYAAMASGEPTGEEKMKEAKRRMEEFSSTYAADLQINNKEAEAGPFDAPVETAPEMQGVNPGNPGDMAPETAPMPQSPPQAVSFSDDPEGAFSALQQQFGVMQNRMAEKDKLNRQLLSTVNALELSKLRTDFAAEVDGLRKAGHVLPGKTELDLSFADAIGSRDRAKSLQTLRKLLASTPKQQTAAGVGQVFSADKDNETVDFSDNDIKESIKRVRDTLDFSDDSYATSALTDE